MIQLSNTGVINRIFSKTLVQAAWSSHLPQVCLRHYLLVWPKRKLPRATRRSQHSRPGRGTEVNTRRASCGSWQQCIYSHTTNVQQTAARSKLVLQRLDSVKLTQHVCSIMVSLCFKDVACHLQMFSQMHACWQSRSSVVKESKHCRSHCCQA